jgi:hypothetical protein
MRRILSLIGNVIIGVSAYTIINKEWQLKVALEDINVTSVFNKSNIISGWA